jgi:hypothetical protein
MKLYGTIAVRVAGAEILNRPGVFARLRKALGGEPDLRTGRVRASLEAAALVDAARHALTELGATNAISLVIDDLVLFHDRDRRADDLGDLFLAFHDASAAIGELGLLRLAVEHVEAGLHFVLEIQARSEHERSEPAVRVIVSARIQAFEPRAQETAEDYRRRVEPLTRDRQTVELARCAFDSFVARVRDAIARAMPEAHAEVTTSEARLVVPDGERRRAPAKPTDAGYDPYEAYAPSPMLGLMTMAMLGSFLAMPGIQVVDAAGAPVEPAAPEPEAETGGDDGDLLDLDWG